MYNKTKMAFQNFNNKSEKKYRKNEALVMNFSSFHYSPFYLLLYIPNHYFFKTYFNSYNFFTIEFLMSNFHFNFDYTQVLCF